MLQAFKYLRIVSVCGVILLVIFILIKSHLWDSLQLKTMSHSN